MKTFPIRHLFLVFVGIAALTRTGMGAISFSDFSDASSLQLNGSAQAPVTDDANRKVLRLTTSDPFEAGSAFSKDKISLANDASFSTFFSFRFSQPQNGGADGMVFVVQNVANNVGAAGGGIGYQGLPNSVGVEFDTFDNGPFNGDPDGNHVAIDVDGNFDTTGTNVDPLGQMDQGGIFYAWVDYNGATDTMDVRLNNVDTRPLNPIVSRGGLDLPNILGDTEAFVGFTAGTGAAYNNHDVLSWGFRGDFNPFPGSSVPDAGPGALAPILCLSLLGANTLMRRKQRA